MRRRIWLLLLATCGLINAQTTPDVVPGSAFHPNNGPHPRMTREEYALKVVEHLMSFPSPLSNGAIQLHRLGDRAAAYVSTILETRGPLSDAECFTVLDIVHKAYEKPAAIMDPKDRTSTAATVALLWRIAGTATAPKVRLRAFEEQVFVSTISAITPPPRTGVGQIGPPPAPGTTPFR